MHLRAVVAQYKIRPHNGLVARARVEFHNSSCKNENLHVGWAIWWKRTPMLANLTFCRMRPKILCTFGSHIGMNVAKRKCRYFVSSFKKTKLHSCTCGLKTRAERQADAVRKPLVSLGKTTLLNTNLEPMLVRRTSSHLIFFRTSNPDRVSTHSDVIAVSVQQAPLRAPTW